MFETDGLSTKRKFYNVLKGKKCEKKQVILNACLTLCAIRWECTMGKRKGLTLDSNTFQQYMKVLFAVFTKQELEYNYVNDFNATGEFHGVVLGVWNEQKKQEPTFGTLANRAQFDDDADTKIRLAHKNNLFDPFAPVDNKKITMMLLG